MTLVEVMISMIVFTVAILGTVGVFTFGLQTMDEARSFSQATQLLNHEMESMRIRQWNGLYPTGSSFTA
jgi:Tfp pilus assembly protein PilV